MKILIALVMLTVSAVARSSSPVAAVGDSNLRGVSVVNDEIVWVSGSKGTIARSTDGGNSWKRMTPPQRADAFDFRDIEAFSADLAYVMSIGPGEQSRIWKTRDGGKSWQQQYADESPDFFLDSLACWNKKHCVALSDPVGGKFVVLMTDDGEHWHELPRDHMPPALVEKRKTADGKDDDLKEGAFAASGTAIAVFGPNIWFGTGGPKARVFHSADFGKTWTVAETPIMHGEPSQGIFSIAFRDAKHGVVVGGDYKEPDKAGANAAESTDGGKTWKVQTYAGGYRSTVAGRQARFIAAGPNGMEFCDWALGTCASAKQPRGCNAVSTGPQRTVCVGVNGLIQRIVAPVMIRKEAHP
jgi:photosystem II stability/assembly factor-like uncharacterized protein